MIPHIIVSISFLIIYQNRLVSPKALITYIENAIETSLNLPKDPLAATKYDYATFEDYEADVDRRVMIENFDLVKFQYCDAFLVGSILVFMKWERQIDSYSHFGSFEDLHCIFKYTFKLLWR